LFDEPDEVYRQPRKHHLHSPEQHFELCVAIGRVQGVDVTFGVLCFQMVPPAQRMGWRSLVDMKKASLLSEQAQLPLSNAKEE
jgi:hypothetical protein